MSLLIAGGESSLRHTVLQFSDVPGESIEIRACARDLRLQMDPENGFGGTS